MTTKFIEYAKNKKICGGGNSEVSGTINIEANGIYNVAKYASANVDVPDTSGMAIEVMELPTPTAEDVGKVYLNTTDGSHYVCELKGGSLTLGGTLGEKLYFDTSIDPKQYMSGQAYILGASDATNTSMFALQAMGMDGVYLIAAVAGDGNTLVGLIYADSTNSVVTIEAFNQQFGTSMTAFGWQMEELDTSAFADYIIAMDNLASFGNFAYSVQVPAFEKANADIIANLQSEKDVLQSEKDVLQSEKDVLQEQYDEANNLAVLLGNSAKELYIPDDTILENGTLEGCVNLTKVSVPSIENRRFYSLFGNKTTSVPSSLETVEIRGGSIVNNGFLDCNGIKSVTINAATVGATAFSGCSSLKSVTIGNNVTSIGSGAWNYVYGIKDVYAYIDSWLNISFINYSEPNRGQQCILHILDSNGNEITELIIPDSVTNIGESLFRRSGNLRSVTIPDTVTSIGRSAFSESGITSVTIGNGVTSIGDSAFSHCSGLTSVIIGNSVETINYAAFNSCTNLVRIIIPDSIKTIGSAAIVAIGENPCYVIKAIEPPTVSINSFETPCTIYVPLASVEAYKSATNWSAFARYIMPYVATVEELANIDGTTYDKACVGTDYVEYTYNGTAWEVYTR